LSQLLSIDLAITLRGLAIYRRKTTTESRYHASICQQCDHDKMHNHTSGNGTQIDPLPKTTLTNRAINLQS
jgi:hypothetical protein